MRKTRENEKKTQKKDGRMGYISLGENKLSKKRKTIVKGKGIQLYL